jgi:serine/threonine-protein kinase
MGVVHRDVKPGNILRSDDGAVKLADFGIAKAMASQLSQITQAGSVLGTAAYLAPEQASGAEVTPAADLYGLGVVTYQLLAGRLPYDAASLSELAHLQQHSYPVRLDELTSDVPTALAVAVQRALSLEPEQRFASAEEMRRVLQDGARGIGPVDAEATAATAMLTPSEPTAATRAISTSRPRRLQPQEPSTPPPPLYEPEYVPPARTRRGDVEPARAGPGRAIAVVLVLALVAALIAFAYGGSQGGSNGVKITPVDGGKVSDVVGQMTKLIDDNTR